jgi:hypothetical protein
LKTSLAASTSEEGEINLDDVKKASAELLSQWKARTGERNKVADDHFSDMAKTMVGLAKDHVKGQRTSTRRVFSSGLASKRSQDGDLKGWSIATLEKSQHVRHKTMESSITQPIGGKGLTLVSLDEGEKKPLYHPSLQGLSAETILSQEVGGTLEASIETLLPLSIPLRSRKSRRCRAELAESRPGILVKPKLNPLEGDSSLRTGHGQWWKKVRYQIYVYTSMILGRDHCLP